MTLLTTMKGLPAALVTMCLALACAASGQDLRPYEETLEGTLVTFEMVPVPGGTYEYTDPDTGETETLEIAPFWVAKHEVTWDEYDVYMHHLDDPEGGGGSDAQGSGDETDDTDVTDPDAISRPSKPYGSPDLGWGHQGYAAIHVTYKAAQTYCKWLSLKTGRNYRLPTEPEWEYACRAGGLPCGPIADEAEVCEMAWCAENSEGKAQAVSCRRPNEWGICDMLGNVAEWCASPGRKHAVRGGSFEDAPEAVYPGKREQQSADWQMSDPQIPKSRWWLSDGPFIGFRVVCDPEPAQ